MEGQDREQTDCRRLVVCSMPSGQGEVPCDSMWMDGCHDQMKVEFLQMEACVHMLDDASVGDCDNVDEAADAFA